ncbi:MAG TPA: hypothetical protein VNK04_03960 [Gemmataceae bacterium]|nr:hypothetical protein [Gemmataceae bacterium]
MGYKRPLIGDVVWFFADDQSTPRPAMITDVNADGSVLLHVVNPYSDYWHRVDDVRHERDANRTAREYWTYREA